MFGWVVSGPVNKPEDNIVSTHLALDGDTNQSLNKFWELESVQERKHQTVEERECEKHFTKITRRSYGGRFIVQMPFKTSNVQLGLSKANAKKRYMNLERKLHREPGLHE